MHLLGRGLSYRRATMVNNFKFKESACRLHPHAGGNSNPEYAVFFRTGKMAHTFEAKGCYGIFRMTGYLLNWPGHSR